MSHATVASAADINNRFDYHPPSPERVTAHEKIREACRDLAHRIDSEVPPSREKSLALTHLDDVMYCANAAIARHAR